MPVFGGSNWCLEGHQFDSGWGVQKLFFSEYCTWEHFFIYLHVFHFVQVTIYSNLSNGSIVVRTERNARYEIELFLFCPW